MLLIILLLLYLRDCILTTRWVMQIHCRASIRLILQEFNFFLFRSSIITLFRVLLTPGLNAPLEYLQVYRWSPLFLYFLFIWSLLIVKLLMFPYGCLFLYIYIYKTSAYSATKQKNEYQRIFLACAQLLIRVKFVSQYALYALIFNPFHSCING